MKARMEKSKKSNETPKKKNKPNSGEVMNIISKISKIRRSIKKINNICIIFTLITVIPYTFMFADWCKEITDDATYISVVSLLVFSYICLLLLGYNTIISPIIETKCETIARLEIRKKELLKRTDPEMEKIISNIKYKKIIQEADSVVAK